MFLKDNMKDNLCHMLYEYESYQNSTTPVYKDVAKLSRKMSIQKKTTNQSIHMVVFQQCWTSHISYEPNHVQEHLEVPHVHLDQHQQQISEHLS